MIPLHMHTHSHLNLSTFYRVMEGLIQSLLFMKLVNCLYMICTYTGQVYKKVFIFINDI